MILPITVNVSFNGTSHPIVIEDSSTELFLYQCMSISEIEPHRQVFIGLKDPFALQYTPDLSNVGLFPNQNLVLCPSENDIVPVSLDLPIFPQTLLPFSQACISNPLQFASSQEQKAIIQQCLGLMQQRSEYETPHLQSHVLKHIPILPLLQDSLTHGASPPFVDTSSPSFESVVRSQLTICHESECAEKLFKGVLDWFHSTFQFVKQLSCEVCQSQTESAGRAQPNFNEQIGRAQIVELYKCTKCSHFTRFPRYNSVIAILESKRGRCGEFVQAFACILRSLLFKVRIVNDFKDHLWVEIRSPFINNGHWTHVDPCEKSVNKPLLYSKGWKKKYSMVLAFDSNSVVDVTTRYQKGSELINARRKKLLGPQANEWLSTLIVILSKHKQINLSIDDVRWIEDDVRKEIDELKSLVYEDEGDHQEYSGRISGTL
ncbi:hypothetical protein P9112_006591 [Eukaryota sp. TZLM1-RC]